mmetsp:Transcript_21391/g.45756  ORF Transcript_21391/g.45756 Transcript_21391/m.45756 type:complete len:461 (-) Transcript_21391:102-1484(-)
MAPSQMGGTMLADWQGSVVQNLTTADSTHKQASAHMVAGLLTVRSTNSEHGKQRDAVHSMFAKKILNTQELCQLLSSRIHSVKKTIQHTEWSRGKLRDAIEGIKEPINVCKTRLELRQTLPRREKVSDAFQDALLQEERDLQATKRKLVTALGDSDNLLRMLTTKLQELEMDLRDKKHSQKLDHMCIDKKVRDLHMPTTLDKCYSRGSATPAEPALAELVSDASAPASARETIGRSKERNRQSDTMHNLEQALAAEDTAKHRWAETSLLLEVCQKTIAKAAQFTQAEMAAKVEHTEVLRQELLKQQRATNHKAEDLKKYLGLTTDKLQAIEKPLSCNATRERIRGGRTPREDIADQVSEALTQQLHALKGKKMQLETQTIAMHDTLRDLHSTQRSLQEDIADKDRAIAIERQCASLRKEAHGTHSFGFSKVGQGQRHFADTAASMMRHADRSPQLNRPGR